MKQKWMVSLFAILMGASQVGLARPLTLDQKLQDFHQLTTYIDANYGPLEYKVKSGILDVKAHYAKYEAVVRATSTNREFYYAIAQFVAAFKDGHFGVRIPSDYVASIPITADYIGGKVLITRIDRTQLPEAQFGFAVGDEVVEMDGTPAEEYLQRASSYIPTGNDLSRTRIASWTVFFRRASYFPVTSRQTLKLKIRRGTSQLIDPVELKWNFSGQQLDEADDGRSHMLVNSVTGSKAVKYDRLVNESLNAFRHPLDRDFSCQGKTRQTIPEGAVTIMKEPFTAYYHPSVKGNIGYLRIPHYYPTDAKTGEFTTAAAETYFLQYEYAVRELEKHTVGLVIDQDHNCGGSVDLVNSMLSLFVERPFQPSQFELLANKESYLDFKAWVDSTPAGTVAREAVESVLKLIEETWLRGSTHLTLKTSISGEPMIQPHRIRYTKPIVVTIDEMAGSGGDMFPAMIQGLGRAKLFGKTTSGLGGHVSSVATGLSNSQIKYRVTKSLFYRPDMVAIENNGAVPDYEYDMTRDDVLYGFRGYQKAFESYLDSFIP